MGENTKCYKPYNYGLAMSGLEETLLKAAEGYKGTKNIRLQVFKEALANGATIKEAGELTNSVLGRLTHTETGRQSNAFGVAHNPLTQTQNIAKRVKECKSY